MLLAEYHALYRLAEFRMASLDRRVPLTGAALVAFLGSVPALPGPVGLVLLVFVPASVIWFVRTTINHARSFEDALRRIELLEQRLNLIAGEELIGFQSTHPSRGKATGGRTGTETIEAVGLASALLLGSCGYVAGFYEGLGPAGALAYCGYLAAIAAYVLAWLRHARRYRYAAATETEPPAPPADSD